MAAAFVRLAGLVWVIFLLAQRRLTLSDVGWRQDHVLRETGRGVAGFLLIALALLGILRLGGMPLRAMMENISAGSFVEHLLWVGIGIGAALVEETIFRGWLQRALVHRGGLAIGIIATAVLFDLSHFTLRPVALSGRLAVGLVLGVLRGRDRPLTAPAIAHALTWAVLGRL
jgi:hypothetical protein